MTQMLNSLDQMMMAMVGLETLAYIKPELEGDILSYVIYSADGTRLAQFDTEEGAYYTALVNDLAPTKLH